MAKWRLFFKSSAAVDKFPEIFGVRLIGRGGGTGDGGLLDASDNVSGVANGAVRELSSQSLRRFDLRIQRKKIIFNTVLEIKQEGKKKIKTAAKEQHFTIKDEQEEKIRFLFIGK